MLLQLVAALLIIINPAPTHLSPFRAALNGHFPLRYAIARVHADRIQADADYAAALAVSTRIQADADAEVAYAAAVERQAEADAYAARIAAEAARLAAVQPARAQPPQATVTTALTAHTAPDVPTSPNVWSGQALRDAATTAGWPASELSGVERRVACESGGQTTAVSPDGLYVGLMQVDPSLHGAVPSDAIGQLAQAYGVWLKQSWAAWGCR